MSYKDRWEPGPILTSLIIGFMILATISASVQIYLRIRKHDSGISHWCDCKVAK